MKKINRNRRSHMKVTWMVINEYYDMEIRGGTKTDANKINGDQGEGV